MPQYPGKHKHAAVKRSYTGKAAVPPMIGGLGVGVIWAIDFWGNVDFVLSLRNGIVANLLQFLLDWGIWFLLAACITWYVRAVVRNQEEGSYVWPAVIMTALVSFGAGTVFTANAVGYRTFKLKKVGIVPLQNCEAIVPMGDLRRFSNRYNFVLACGPIDPSVDRYGDTNAALSEPFTISSSDTHVLTRSSVPGLDFRNVAQFWFYPVLIPKGVRREQYQTLGDLVAVGGLLLDDDEELTVFPD